MRKASSTFACRQGRHLRLERAALVSRAPAAGIYYFPRPAERATSPTNPFLRCQPPRASFLPQALLGLTAGQGSCCRSLGEDFRRKRYARTYPTTSNETLAAA